MAFCVPRPEVQSSERSFGCSDVLRVFKSPHVTYVMCHASLPVFSTLQQRTSPAAARPSPSDRAGATAVQGCAAPRCPAQHPRVEAAVAWAALPRAWPFPFPALGFKRISCSHFKWCI